MYACMQRDEEECIDFLAKVGKYGSVNGVSFVKDVWLTGLSVCMPA